MASSEAALCSSKRRLSFHLTTGSIGRAAEGTHTSPELPRRSHLVVTFFLTFSCLETGPGGGLGRVDRWRPLLTAAHVLGLGPLFALAHGRGKPPEGASADTSRCVHRTTAHTPFLVFVPETLLCRMLLHRLRRHSHSEKPWASTTVS